MALRAISLSELELALSGDPSYRDKTGAEIYVKKLQGLFSYCNCP
jgi:hypothetical protein